MMGRRKIKERKTKATEIRLENHHDGNEQTERQGFF